MFGKSNRQRLKEFKELMKNKNDSDIEQVVNDDNFSIADNFVAEDYIDFMDDFDNPDNNDFLDIRQYEHVIDLQDFEEEDDAQNFSGSANLAPLYDNAILSDVEFSMGIMALAREKHLSDATINDVLNVFRSILPESNKVPATYNKGQLQCTESAFFKCICEINNIQQCQAIAQLAPPNFVHIQKTGNVFTIATRATFYEIIKSNGNKVSRLVPESKIFSVTLNAEDRLKVGGLIVDGESEDPTFIARLFPDTFTMDPVPTTPPIPIPKKLMSIISLSIMV